MHNRFEAYASFSSKPPINKCVILEEMDTFIHWARGGCQTLQLQCNYGLHQPYPFGSGFFHEKKVCSIDNQSLIHFDMNCDSIVVSAMNHMTPTRWHLNSSCSFHIKRSVWDRNLSFASLTKRCSQFK